MLHPLLLRRALLLSCACLAACGEGGPDRARASLVGAGDIASCWWRADESTARLLDKIDGVVFTVGDNVYQDGSLRQYARCYAPTWGRHLERTRPTPGNHDYKTRDGAGYFAYFGARAGEPGKGWYSYEVDGWHVVALNTEEEVGEDSEQLRWLREDLRRHRTRCTLAYMHHPRFSSGKHGGRDQLGPLWNLLYASGVEVVLAGHDHHYERFAPQTPDGRLDRAKGIRQFIVGTGGAPHYA
ncbi:MAG TPA: metallophosphoesterase, partial [Longimicrobiaceae bacterium]|nr:metallophosphoesterase [Longimicrobiaceae bacterium]